MENSEQEDHVEAAFLDLQAMHGHLLFVPPAPPGTPASSLPAQEPVNGNEQLAASSQTVPNSHAPVLRSLSFEDLHMSVGASTLAMDIVNAAQGRNHINHNHSSRMNRSPSAMSFFEPSNSTTAARSQFPTADVPQPVNNVPVRDLHPQPLQVQHDETAAVHEQEPTASEPERGAIIISTQQIPNALGIYHQSTFTHASQVPDPLVVSSSTTSEQPDNSHEQFAGTRSNRVVAPHNFSSTDNIDSLQARRGVRVPPLRTASSVLSIVVASDTANVLHSQENRSQSISRQATEPPQPGNTEAPTESQEFSPPDGGLRAWLQVLGAFFVIFNVWGLILSFGAFLAYYHSVLLPDVGHGMLALIGAFQPSLILLFAPLWHQILSRGGFRLIFTVGSLILVLSVFCTAWCETWSALLLVQGFGTGFGMSMVFAASEDLLTTYFAPDGRLGVALAFSRCGMAPGALVSVTIMKNLTRTFTFPWAMRTLGFVALFTMLLANVLLRARTLDQRPRSVPYQTLLSRTSQNQAAADIPLRSKIGQAVRSVFILRMLPFWLLILGLFIGSFGVLGPFYLVVAEAIDVQRLSGYTAVNYLLAMVVAPVPGFLLPPIILFKRRLANRTGPPVPGNQGQTTSASQNATGDVSSQPPASHDQITPASPIPTGNSAYQTSTPRNRTPAVQEAIDARVKVYACRYLIWTIAAGTFFASVFSAVRASSVTRNASFAFDIFVALGMGPILGTTPLILHSLCFDFPVSHMRAIMRTASGTETQIQRQKHVVLVKAIIIHTLLAIGFFAGSFLAREIVAADSQGYSRSMYYSGAVMLVSFLLLAVAGSTGR